MKTIMVRYKVKPEHVAENETLVRAVYEELGQAKPDGFQYATFRLDDGVSFAHIASIETDDGRSPLADIAAFKRFTDNIRERCDDDPVTAELTEVGSFRFFGQQ
jgi:hypothetical protein